MTTNNTFLRKKATELAKRALYEKFSGGLNGKEMLITSTRISSEIKTEFFGYKLVTSGTFSVGQRIQNPDGTVTTVEDILR
jgi:hypothetical protein